ncbi:fatty acid transporter [Ophiostoma piceae UAMH 11346]|uniref:Very long-chain fatty acid transport protein n=1 Tax=Ophiostoma piceae (strain UAMH 11346) TaxID=1262450 RepID=S3CT18_OPHP1|nr:fatty acid transporter [Ophiostoma piceae UAMH 11346]
MPVPLALAVPTAAAGLAYLNARSSFWYDVHMISSVIPGVVSMAVRGRRGTINMFYRFEDMGTSSATANDTFLLFGDVSYTYGETYNRILRYGNWWKTKMGIKKHDVVALTFMNSDTFIFLWLGLWAIGATPAFINYNLRDAALLHCIQTSNAKLVIVDPAVQEAITDNLKSQLGSDTRIEIFSASAQAAAETTEAVRAPDEDRHETKREAIAILIFTSGTTGLPKAAVVSWAKMISIGNFACRWMGLEKRDVYYTCMPLYHSSAGFLCMGPVLYRGATMALGRKFSNKTFWPDVRKFNATAIQYVGETCRYLLSAPAHYDPDTNECLDRKHNVRVALGNGLRPDVWNRFKERFGIETIAEFYGATEGTMATFNLSRNDFTMGAVGRNGWLYELAVGQNVALVSIDWVTETPSRDPKTKLCRRSKRGEPGELIFKLPPGNIGDRFQGYFGNKKATESKVLRDVFQKGDAWFRTGDVMLKDIEGRTYFHDRIGDTFRWKSENVSTTEVAQAVGLHESVVEANVYGIALPGHDGRAGCVALVLKDGQATPEFLGSLIEHIEKTLPRYARPLFLRIVEDSSAHTTGTNKQQKHVLREQGADPSKVGEDAVFWLQDGAYVPFGRNQWSSLEGGKVKL